MTSKNNNDIPTIFEMLVENSKQYPNDVAVLFKEQNISLTWKQMVEQVDHLAAGMFNLGLSKGDRVAIWSRNRVEMLLTQLASTRLGIILVFLNDHLSLVEFEMVLNIYSCKALFIQPTHSPYYFQYLNNCPGMIRFISVLSMGIMALKKGLDIQALEKAVSMKDTVSIVFKGSDEERKTGAQLSQEMIVNKGISFAKEKSMSRSDIFCVDVPLFNISGNICSVISCIHVGCAMVFPGEISYAPNTLKVLQDEKCTILNSTISGYQNIMLHPQFNPTKYEFKEKFNCYSELIKTN
ncbi:hypothetical protein PPL_12395 [Heterostelium album PN500]|uniref:AMP-dependent synthetase/ligase domain-containing protein n=1 Tax=Heterostelium pallidum (strain ATCC 26659 / Pp 5 / PN500) TaxID=670386 RepID=D3BMH5_HETP5|nr:hypothetical protein PPL_12395 [Heterostelium album PN500]EFA77187.1 hypothetical protein PPL_12395 [Heterostelium album PN500]|eukprot:XP_020429316.1 hypothetical protein PPL_12395 [Heterostelium album PN500]